MIVVPQYYVGLGNNMFQYAWPRVCAEQLGYAFSAPPLLNLATDLDGLRYETPVQKVTDFEIPNVWHGVPIGDVLDNHEPRKIVMWGFFQQANKYSSYRNRIKSWFKSSLTPVEHPADTLGISIRTEGDYVALGWNLPVSYYDLVLRLATEKIRPSTCLIYADVKDSKQLKEHVKIISKYCDAKIQIHLNGIDQLQSLMGCQHIIGCNSTFSWWATFLSNARNVWSPHDYQPWGVGQKGDKTWPNGHLYPVDLRHYEDGWHVVYGGDFL